MNKGIVMELSESSIIVMRADGKFDKLPRGSRNCQVGEEILYADAKPRLKVPSMAIASGLVAAVVFCLVLFTGLTGTTASGEVVAYVTIDINPSVEIGIDDKEKVLDLRGLNTDGVNLIISLTYKGKSLQDVTSAILDKAEQGTLAKGEGDIVISSTLVLENAKINDEDVAAKLKQQVLNHIKDAHPNQTSNYDVTSFAAPQEVRKQALESGVSTGKYAIYLNALNNGTDVTLDQIKDVSIHQIAKDNGGIGKLINPTEPITKTNLKQLVEEEKSGKLAEKVQQSDKGKTNKNDKNDKSSSGNSGTNNGNSKTEKPTATDKNSKNDNKNINNSNNNNNNNNDKNSKNDDNNGNSPGKKDDNGKRGSSSSPSPTAKPTAKPTPTKTPSPTPKQGSGSDGSSGSKDDKQNESNKDKIDGVKKDDSKNDGNTKDDNKTNNG
jgi:hypothetical protein